MADLRQNDGIRMNEKEYLVVDMTGMPVTVIAARFYRNGDLVTFARKEPGDEYSYRTVAEFRDPMSIVVVDDGERSMLNYLKYRTLLEKRAQDAD